MKHSLIGLLALLFVMACTPTVPSQFIQPDEMEDLLYDYHVAQAMARLDHPGESGEVEKNRNFLAVLNKYGVTQAEFDSSLVYYYSHLDKLKKIYIEVNERLSDNAKSLGADVGTMGHFSQYTANGDTANIWTGTTDLLLMPRPTMNRFDFTVKVDTAFHKGDSFLFQFMTEYIWQNGMKDAVVCFVSKYEGDSIIQTVNHVAVAGLAQIRIPANKENKLKEMKGYIYLGRGNDLDDKTRKMMFISQMQLIRFHDKEVQNESEIKVLQKDSIQSSNHPGGEKLDSAGDRANGRLRHKTISPPPGATIHRMDAGSDRIKTKP